MQAKNIFTGFNRNMKIRINNKFTYLPLAKSKGTTEQRLQKATDMNLKFFKGLKYDFKDREIKPMEIKRNLWDVIGKKLTINLMPIPYANDVNITHSVAYGRQSKGYTLSYPYDSLWEKPTIFQSKTPNILRQTQLFFTEILNPKFFRRKVSMMNQGQDCIGTMGFFKENIHNSQKLEPKKLDRFLQDKNVLEKINTLQMFRYDLMAEKNLHGAEPLLDRQVAKFESLRFDASRYDMNKFNYEEKLQILNDKLKEVLAKVRERLHNR